MLLPITSVFAAGFLVMLVVLSLWVSVGRIGGKVSLGHGDNAALERRIRAHGNFVENTPLGLIALALVELQGGSADLLWGLGAAMAVGRVLHALGLMMKVHIFRQLGTVLTGAMMLTAAWRLAVLSGYLNLG